MSRLPITLDWAELQANVSAGHDTPLEFAGVPFHLQLLAKGTHLQCRLHTFQLPATWAKLRLGWHVSFVDQKQQSAFHNANNPPATLECTLDAKQVIATEWCVLPGAWPDAYETLLDDMEQLSLVCDLSVWDVQYPPAHMLQCMFETLCRDHYLSASRTTWNEVLDENKRLRASEDIERRNVQRTIQVASAITRDLREQLQTTQDKLAAALDQNNNSAPRKRPRSLLLASDTDDTTNVAASASATTIPLRPNALFAMLSTVDLSQMTRADLQAAQQHIMAVQVGGKHVLRARIECVALLLALAHFPLIRERPL
jgi:hypothetical protein